MNENSEDPVKESLHVTPEEEASLPDRQTIEMRKQANGKSDTLVTDTVIYRL